MGFDKVKLSYALMELSKKIESGELEYKSGEFSISYGYPNREYQEISLDGVKIDSGDMHIEIDSNLLLVGKNKAT